jgi:inositol-hexakisphosphate/diphosphoinositol-pentakisphosphate 1-kinase
MENEKLEKVEKNDENKNNKKKEKKEKSENSQTTQSTHSPQNKSHPQDKIKVGICAMDKKVNSKQMQNILKGLESFNEFDIILMNEDIFYNRDIEDWPIVHALIIFFSNGFPYCKALKYIQLRKPFLINDFEMQKIFWDRRKVYQMLEENNIPTPYHLVIDRGEEINNDGESSLQMNKSEEIENMINLYTKTDTKEYNSSLQKNFSNSQRDLFKSYYSESTSKPTRGGLSSIGGINELSHGSLISLEEQYFKENVTCASPSPSPSMNQNQNVNFSSIKESINTTTINFKKNSSKESIEAPKENSQSDKNLDFDNEKNDVNLLINNYGLINTNTNLNNCTTPNHMPMTMTTNFNYEETKTSPTLDDFEKEVVEFDDYIEFKGKKIVKPFVEKPCNGDDHNIFIYYPPSLGGGHKRLFRKTKNLCSLYIPNEDTIRRDKSYIYEEFLQTDGFDIKVYTIGPQYAHAEARKSPCLDGKVMRSGEGKEVRYPVNLSPFEKELARKIVAIFKQNICGFDILRTSKGKSYVCDVNGWSFVKGNKKYYEDCAILIRKMILTNLDPLRYARKPLTLKIRVPTYEELILPHRPNSQNQGHKEELRSVVAVFRHADRSPKQKMKLVVNHPLILNLFKKFGKQSPGSKIKEIKLKKPKELMEVLNIASSILEEHHIDEDTIYGLNDSFFNKLFQLKMVLEKNMNFEGMTRKIQLKPLRFIPIKSQEGKEIETVSEALFIFKWGGDITHSGIEQAKLLGQTFRVQMYPSSTGDGGDGDGLLRLHSTYRHDLKCYSADEGRCLKTSAAFLQGLLQLEGSLIPIISSMVRRDEPVLDLIDSSLDEISDVKNKVKEEVSECLHHDGNLLDKFKSYFKDQVIFQSSDASQDTQDHSLFKLMDKIKNPMKMLKNLYSLMDKLIQYIKTLLTQEELELDSGTYLIRRHAILEKRVSDSNMNYTDINLEQMMKNCKKDDTVGLSNLNSLNLSNLNNPNKSSKNLTNVNSSARSINGDSKQIEFDCEDEKIILIYKRWIKLYQDFYNTKKKKFDVSKIPDIYDNIKYDLIHNKSLLNDDAYNLFYNVNLLANFVMPLEYGITVDEKVRIGLKVTANLLNKIHNDLLWWFYPNSSKSPQEYVKDFENENQVYSGLDRGRLNANDVKSAWRHVKTRYYFTCASHLYSLINTIIFGIDSFLIDQTESNQIFIKELKNVLDLDYCSHIVFRLYENFNFDFVRN